MNYTKKNNAFERTWNSKNYCSTEKVLVFYCFDYDSFPPKFSTCGRKTSINGFSFPAQNGIWFLGYNIQLWGISTEICDISEIGDKFPALKKFRNS